jgi:hypothetical protein
MSLKWDPDIVKSFPKWLRIYVGLMRGGISKMH